MDRFTIKSVDTDARLSFAFPGHYGGTRRSDYLDVDFFSQSLSSRLTIWLYEGDRQSLASLFTDMAENWKGWKGDKTWISAEGNFQLVCSSDRLGHIAIEVELSQHRSSEPWFSRFTLMTEAGQLEKLANAAHKVLMIE